MSEYQYYYFEAIDQPLTEQQQKELRSISTRARINSRRFENEYNFGDLKADPEKLLKKYFRRLPLLRQLGNADCHVQGSRQNR